MDDQRKIALALAQRRYDERMRIKPRSILGVLDFNAGEFKEIVVRSLELKADPGRSRELLKGKQVALLFQKTSTRTRCSFEAAAWELGAACSYIEWSTSNFVRSDLADEIVVLSRFFDLIVARVNEHDSLNVMARHSEVPIINGLSNMAHPCQVVGDFATLSEYFGAELRGLTIAYIGDGNNVCRSLAHACGLFGVRLKICSPPGYGLDRASLERSNGMAVHIDSIREAVELADVIYTDTWVSMGDEAEAESRRTDFAQFRISQRVLDLAPRHALVMHCLPAHPGDEIDADVLRGPRSIVFDQTENRKHGQKALLEYLFERR